MHILASTYLYLAKLKNSCEFVGMVLHNLVVLDGSTGATLTGVGQSMLSTFDKLRKGKKTCTSIQTCSFVSIYNYTYFDVLATLPLKML